MIWESQIHEPDSADTGVKFSVQEFYWVKNTT